MTTSEIIVHGVILAVLVALLAKALRHRGLGWYAIAVEFAELLLLIAGSIGVVWLVEVLA